MKSTAPVQKITGQSFIGMAFVLAPVKECHTAMITRKAAAEKYTSFETSSSGPAAIVTSATRQPTKARLIPSPTHSIVMMRLLSWDISPKPRTTPLVGNR